MPAFSRIDIDQGDLNVSRGKITAPNGGYYGDVYGTVYGTLVGGVIEGDEVGTLEGAIVLPSYAVATLPAAASSEGMMVHCSDGASGSPCLVYCNGTIWSQIAIGAEAAAGE